MGSSLLLRAARAFGLAAVIGVSMAAPRPAVAQQDQKLINEAQALFKVVDRGKRERCRYDSAWDSRPVTAETAQRYLRLTVHADLVVSEPPAKPAQIIDPTGREADTFCTAQERAAVWREAIAAFKGPDGASFRLTSTSYGFPVFNADYTRAALMVQHFSEMHYRRASDGTLQRSLEMSGGAVIFAKRAGVWKRIDYDSYYTAH